MSPPPVNSPEMAVYASVYGSVYACAFVYACADLAQADLSTQVAFSTLPKMASVDTCVDTQTTDFPIQTILVYSFYSYSKEKRIGEKKEGWGRNTRARVDA